MNDIELAELDALLANEKVPVQDEFTKQTLDVGQSTDMLLEEIEDFEIYETRMNLVNGDLLKYFDNPSIPSDAQRMAMLDQLGETLWYDRWAHERAAQFSELDDLDMSMIEKGLTNEVQKVAKQRVHDIFEQLEMAEVPKKDGLQALADWANENSSLLQAGDAAEYNETFDVPEMSFNRASTVSEFENIGVEMSEIVEQTINLSAPVAELEQINETELFFGIDETTARFSQTAMDALDQVASTGSYGWDLWPTVEEMVGVGETVLSGAAGALVMYGLVEGLTPIIKSLGDTDWIRGGYSVETKESVSITDSITSSMLGPMYKISQKIAKHLEENPTYVWFLDNTNARIRGKKSIHYILWNFIKDSPCSYYWLRGRVVAMEGTKVGYSDSPSKLLLGVKITKTITDMAPSTQTYWINGETAVILRDGAAVQHATNTKNLAKMIFNSWDKYPMVTPSEITALGNDADQKMLDALLGGFDSGDTGQIVPKTKKDIYTQPIFDTTVGADDDATVGTGGEDDTGAADKGRGSDDTVDTGVADKFPFQQIKKDEVDPVPPDTAHNVTDTLGFDQKRRRLPTQMLPALTRVQTQDKFDTPPSKKKRMPTISPGFLKAQKVKSRYTEFRPTRISFENEDVEDDEKSDYLPHIVVVGGLLILFYFQNK